jgi:hypothetical protein
MLSSTFFAAFVANADWVCLSSSCGQLATWLNIQIILSIRHLFQLRRYHCHESHGTPALKRPIHGEIEKLLAKD